MKKIRIKDIARQEEQLAEIRPEDLVPLPAPYDGPGEPFIGSLSADQEERYESSLDGVVAVGIPKPATKEEEEKLVRRFLSGLEKLFSR